MTWNQHQMTIPHMDGTKLEAFKHGNIPYHAYMIRPHHNGTSEITNYLFGLRIFPDAPLDPSRRNLEVQMSLRVFNWTDPTRSIYMGIIYGLSTLATKAKRCYNCIKPEEMPSFLDEDGVLVVQVLEIHEIPTPPNPP